MRCIRIQFNGYKRLANTQCNVSPYLLAFVGQNESGKSSVLNALTWLSEDPGEATALHNLDKSRTNQRDSGWIVGATFQLDASDIDLLRPLGFENVPERVSLWKQADGRLHTTFAEPRDPKRDPSLFATVAQAWQRASHKWKRQIDGQIAADEQARKEWGLATCIAALIEALSDPDLAWEEYQVDAAEGVADWLEQAPPQGKHPRDGKLAGLVREVAQIGARPHPKDLGIQTLRSRIPQFVIFSQSDRVLPTITPIDHQRRDRIPSGVLNLLKIAHIDVDAVWQAYVEGDSGAKRTLLGAGNRRLGTFFGEAWNQSNISVSLDVDERGLITHVVNLDTQRFTRMEERSEGLRAFITLAAFLGSQQFDVPPILLIDEAELHLHADAQADLVGGLLENIDATQVWYTTHSPACLPSDLGTGIRLLERQEEESRIRSHFWTNREPGFGPLLYAMGAGAAAFSRCRWAVLAEGASEMIMLPTLLRKATGLQDLQYQIAPGLSHARGHDIDVEEVAARVIYLTDGDGSGRNYLRQLRAANVDETRLKSLPEGTSIEDLLDRDFLLGVIRGLIPHAALKSTSKLFRPSWSAGRSISKWAEGSEIKLSKVAIAYGVIDNADNIVFSPGSLETLQALHESFMAEFQAR